MQPAKHTAGQQQLTQQTGNCSAMHTAAWYPTTMLHTANTHFISMLCSHADTLPSSSSALCSTAMHKRLATSPACHVSQNGHAVQSRHPHRHADNLDTAAVLTAAQQHNRAASTYQHAAAVTDLTWQPVVRWLAARVLRS